MTFEQQVLSTLCGTLVGFVFAIVLFYVTEQVKKKQSEEHLRRNFKREFQYNISLLQEWIDSIDGILLKIAREDVQVLEYLKYSRYQRFFFQGSFQSGMLYDMLDNEDISNLNAILSHCDLPGEDYINQLIARWRSSESNRQDASGQFEFEKKTLQGYKKQLEKISEKIHKSEWRWQRWFLS